MTGTGERFLLFDSGVGNTNRMFIFATNRAIVIHANSSQCFGDSIFKLCPQIFSQFIQFMSWSIVKFLLVLMHIRNVLLQTDMSGCFFHLSSKHIQRAGLKRHCMNDP